MVNFYYQFGILEVTNSFMNSSVPNLRKAREAKSLTQRELGEIVDVSDTTINRYETGERRPDPYMLAKLADALDTTTDYIIGRFNCDEETLAAHRRDDSTLELPEEARKSLDEFRDFVIRKYSKDG